MKALRRIGASVLIVLFLTTGLSYGQSVAKQILTKGVDYAAQGKFEEAKEEFERALKAAPFLAAARDSLNAIEDVTEGKIERKSVIHLFKGAAYVLKEQWDEGIAQYNKVLKINPRFAIAYRARGFAHCGKGQYDQAISDFTKAIEINPKYSDAYFYRGFAYCEKGQYDRAISDLTKAIEINPRYADAYFYRGFACGGNGQYNQAISDYSKACLTSTIFSLRRQLEFPFPATDVKAFGGASPGGRPARASSIRSSPLIFLRLFQAVAR